LSFVQNFSSFYFSVSRYDDYSTSGVSIALAILDLRNVAGLIYLLPKKGKDGR